MNFFRHQDDARRSTRYLVLLFGLAVLALAGLTNLFLFWLIAWFDPDALYSTSVVEAWLKVFDWRLFLLVGTGVASVILLGSVYKIIALSGGGARVADMLGGELLVDDNADLNRRRLLNIVSEMAIASGTPVPPVYLIEEDGINAFAAGYTTGDAVIGVTRGAIEKLTRDQLQGVIAHEFSHILNGDMRLNIRLIGILHGILLIGLIGRHILRGLRSSRRSKNAGGIMIIGLGLMIIGYAGTFFGKLIKSGVSRQREYLADASAVQYTRNPDGIAGALKRIGGDAKGSIIDNPAAEQISHALFGQGLPSFSGLFATHPPLEKRILRLEPHWDGRFEVPVITPPQADTIEPAPAAAQQPRSFSAGLAAVAAAIASGEIINQVGQPSPESIEQAHALIASIPDGWHHASQSPYSARAVIYALVMDRDETARSAQLDYLQQNGDKGIYEETDRLLASLDRVRTEHRLPLIDLCLGSLHQLSESQYRLFSNNLDALIAMDRKVNLLEWSIRKIVFHHLDPVLNGKIRRAPGRHSLHTMTDACSVLVSALFHAGRQDGADGDAVIKLASQTLGLQGLALLPRDAVTLDRLNTALDALAQLKPLEKPRLLKTCAKVIAFNRKISATEAEMVRAISAILDCPMPPLLVQPAAGS